MFDEEEIEEGYSCKCGGSITLCDDIWYCDKCDFEAPDNRVNKKKPIPVKPQSIGAPRNGKNNNI